MYCKSVSVMTGPFFKINPKLFYLAGLCSNYWCYDFDARVFITFLKKNLDLFFLILVPFGILTNYPNIDSFMGLETTTFNGSYKKFSEKNLWFKGLRHSSRIFLPIFWILPVFFVVFIVNDIL